MALVAASEQAMRDSGEPPDHFFHRMRAGEAGDGALADLLAGYTPEVSDQQWWREEPPVSLLIDEVETIWSAIAERDDWGPLNDRISAIQRLGQALGPAPNPSGHAS